MGQTRPVTPSPHLPLLYSYRRCPYAMRARMALLQAGVPFQVFEIVLRDKPAALLALSPKGTVPVLHLREAGDRGRVIDESWEVMRWAFAKRDADGWWQRAQSAENMSALQRNDGEFKRLLDRHKYPERFAHEGQPADAARQRALTDVLMPLEARLAGSPQLGGLTPCATDLAVFPFVRQFAAVDPLWWAEQPLPALRAWLDGWLTSGLFEACMFKAPPQVVTDVPRWR